MFRAVFSHPHRLDQNV